MHKFQPRVYLVKRREGESGPVTDIEQEQFRSFVFPETQFTAVTAYQNQCITKLKIESNPFAKGFRDSASCDYDDTPYPSLPGGMPGMDPFMRLGGHPVNLQEQNNNLMMEKARFMMMSSAPRPMFSPPTSIPSSSPYQLPLSPELVARYSAIQASLGLYNPALLAAALRQAPHAPLPPARSPDLSPPSHRYSPYPLHRPSCSPTHSPGREEDRRSVSPPSSSPHTSPSPLSRPSFPIFR